MNFLISRNKLSLIVIWFHSTTPSAMCLSVIWCRKSKNPMHSLACIHSTLRYKAVTSSDIIQLLNKRGCCTNAAGILIDSSIHNFFFQKSETNWKEDHSYNKSINKPLPLILSFATYPTISIHSLEKTKTFVSYN